MMKKYLFFLLLIPSWSCKTQQESGTYTGSIEILDDRALLLLESDAKPQIISSGYAWTEGPLWLEEEQALLFSDIPNNAVHRYHQGETTLYLKPSGYTGEENRGGEMGSNALLLDPEGKLILLQHGDRRIARMDSPIDQPKTTYTTLAGSFENKRLNSPNDGVYDSKGNLYFTDPPYGLEKGAQDPAKELEMQGIYRLTPDGALTLLATQTRPNGIVLGLDESYLLVSNSDPGQAVWLRYDFDQGGNLGTPTVFHDCTHLINQPGQQGLPDGMKMHSSGYLFASGPAGIWVFDPQGVPVAKIHTGEKTSNCAFSADEKTLFMTADSHVMQLKLK
jgi:gluconolactonase